LQIKTQYAACQQTLLADDYCYSKEFFFIINMLFMAKISFSLQIDDKNGCKKSFQTEKKEIEIKREKDPHYFTRDATTCIERIGGS